MEGLILIFNTSTKKELTKANQELFGRLVKSKKETYYYPGKLENITYTRLVNGCYLIIKESSVIISESDSYLFYPVIIEGRFKFATAREHWEHYIIKKNLKVKNF